MTGLPRTLDVDSIPSQSGILCREGFGAPMDEIRPNTLSVGQPLVG